MNRRPQIEGSLFGGDNSSDFKVDVDSYISDGRFFTEAINQSKRLPTNYVGNKKRIVIEIMRFLQQEKVEFENVFDAFSGSGVVSVFMALLKKRVTSNDLLTSSALQISCLLEGKASPLSQSEWYAILDRVPKRDYAHFSKENYLVKPKLFTPDEADFLDRYRANVADLFGDTFWCGQPFNGGYNLITYADRKPLDVAEVIRGHPKANYALYAMLKHLNDVCFVGGRFYSGQTLAQLEHRLDHSRNHGHELHKTFLKTVKKLWFPRIEYPAGGGFSLFNSDIMELLKSGALPVGGDLLYLDPPYGGDSSDYASLYRYLEEFVHGKKLEDPSLQVVKTAGDRFKEKNGYDEQFSELLALCGHYKHWLISFNASSFSGLEGITEIIKRFRSQVVVYEVPIKYKYREERKLSTDREYLLLART